MRTTEISLTFFIIVGLFQTNTDIQVGYKEGREIGKVTRHTPHSPNRAPYTHLRHIPPYVFIQVAGTSCPSLMNVHIPYRSFLLRNTGLLDLVDF